MLRRLALALLLAAAPAVASAQLATIAPTAPNADNSDRIANTAFVQNAVGGGGSLALASGKIFIGSAGNIATAQTPSGDLTINDAGVFTFGTVNSNVGSFGSATQCPTITVNAKGQITAASATACSQASGATVKAYCLFAGATTGTHACTFGSNVTSVTRSATGTYTLNIPGGVFTSGTSYSCTATVQDSASNDYAKGASPSAQTATAFNLFGLTAAASATDDPNSIMVMCVGS